MEENKYSALALRFGHTKLPHSHTDDSISAASMSDVHDRLSALELRLQQQEDELMVVKAALADVLRRLPLPEEPVTSRRSTGKGLSMMREAFSMSCIANGVSITRKPGHRDGSSVSVTRKETLSSAAKSGTKGNDKHSVQGTKEKEEPSSVNVAPPPLKAKDAPKPPIYPTLLHSKRHFQENRRSIPAKRLP